MARDRTHAPTQAASVYLSACRTVKLSNCLSICVSNCLSFKLSFKLSVTVSIKLPLSFVFPLSLSVFFSLSAPFFRYCFIHTTMTSTDTTSDYFDTAFSTGIRSVSLLLPLLFSSALTRFHDGIKSLQKLEEHFSKTCPIHVEE